MDEGKVGVLWGYAIETTEVEAEDAGRFFRMYLGEAVDQVKEANALVDECAASLFSSNAKRSASDVLEEIKKSDGPSATMIAAVLAKVPEKIAADAGGASLSTIMGGDFDDDDEDDFGVASGGESDESEDMIVLPEVIMKGLLKTKDDGSLSWTGKWLLSGDKSVSDKFKYVTGASLESHPPVGKPVAFSGAFLMTEDGAKIKVEEKDLELTFSGASPMDVSGTGSNVKGVFTVSGKFDSESKKLVLVRSYEPTTAPRKRQRVD